MKDVSSRDMALVAHMYPKFSNTKLHKLQRAKQNIIISSETLEKAQRLKSKRKSSHQNISRHCKLPKPAPQDSARTCQSTNSRQLKAMSSNRADSGRRNDPSLRINHADHTSARAGQQEEVTVNLQLRSRQQTHRHPKLLA